jgi:hypothetical protein
VKMRFKPSSAQSASLPDIWVLLPPNNPWGVYSSPFLVASHSRAAVARNPSIQLLKDEFFSTCRA